ncbi:MULTISPECIES: hypothetical protein [Gluconobacter]|uniref:hypothetical protein n=1 Tax=Gluconobacter TaxID=441 RepID=UPI0039EA5029
MRSGAHWYDLPEYDGNWKTVHRCFSYFYHVGVGEQVFPALTADHGNAYLRMNSTIIRAHQHTTTRKGGAKRRRGRSRGGLSTKIHMLADAQSRPLRFIITSGQVHNAIQASALLEGQTVQAQ